MIPKSPKVCRLFRAYTRVYLKRSFHALHLSAPFGLPEREEGVPLVVYVSHSSWWDLLVGWYANETVFGWDSYTVMDDRQLQRYAFLAKIGVVGVDRTSLAGSRRFIKDARELLQGTGRALWLAPQGEMVSSQARPLRFQSGLGLLVETLGECDCLPVALEYEFWSEKRPEAFVACGEIQRVMVGQDFERRVFVQECERRLEEQVDRLTLLRLRRDPLLFQLLLTGREGISPIYDTLRRCGASLRGQRFQASHGAAPSPPYRQGSEPERLLNYKDTRKTKPS